MDTGRELLTPNLERALRWAAFGHRGQVRKGSETPYVAHVMAVALILDRLGFDESVVIAGLLHDLIEDTETTLEQVEAEFGPEVARIVDSCSEIKTDSLGRKRPWIDRKRDHLEALADAPVSTRAVVLADKLHNLLNIEVDLGAGRPVWPHFNADRAQVLWYYRTMIERLGAGDPRLEVLARRCRAILTELERRGEMGL